MKITTLLGLVLLSLQIFGQNIANEGVQVALYRTPLKPIAGPPKTYSAKLYELGDVLRKEHRDSLLARSLVIPGLSRVESAGDVQLELVINPFAITQKEVRDVPLETTNNGQKVTTHQYSYLLHCSFPMKLRVMVKGRLLAENDLPSAFTKDYSPQNRNSLEAMQREFDQDYHFQGRLVSDRLEENGKYLKNMLASEYGEGMHNEFLTVLYVKDKKGIYPDINQAMSLMVDGLKYAHNNANYLDDQFKSKINQALELYNKALMESSDDKKARIDPKVTTLIHYNIGLAYYCLRQYNQAQEWLEKAMAGDGNTRYTAKHLLDLVADKKQRMAATPVSVDMSVPAENDVPTAKDIGSGGDFIILKSGDSVRVKFIMPSRETMPYGDSLWLQDQIIVWNNDKRIEAYPGELKGYVYQGIYRQSIEWRVDASKAPMKVTYKFCKCTEYGAISLFDCYNVEPSFTDKSRMVVQTERWYAKGNEISRAMFGNFKKNVSKLVEEYPELSSKVAEGAYERNDFQKIIKDYNLWVKAQPK